MFGMTGKVIVVTGAKGLLGVAITKILLQEGVMVCSLDQHYDASDRMRGNNRLEICCDVTSKSQVEAARTVIVGQWGRVDALINCAGIDSPPDADIQNNGSIESVSLDRFMETIRVNTGSIFVMAQVFGPQMSIDGGAIVNVGSVYGHVAPDQRLYEYRKEQEGRSFYKPAAYGASKAAVSNLTKWLASYWRGSRLRIVNLVPGGIENGQAEEFQKAYSSRCASNRLAHVDEIAKVASFLASDQSSYINGTDIVVDGGLLAT
jgi:NAD(P)-dependent dehydrogenase (short-subunit alcohol dehydrogenase family)